MPYTSPTTVVTGTTIASTWGNSVKAATDYLANPPACRVYNSANLSIPDNALTALTFNTERYDTDSMHSTVTNTGRITFTTAGIYNVGFVGSFDAAAQAITYAEVNIRRAGTDVIANQALATIPVGFTVPLHVTTQFKFAAADYIEVVVYQDNAANVARNIVAAASKSPEFWATWVGLG